MTPGRDPKRFPSLFYEEGFWNSGYTRVAGIDEAGRGAWAGPVYAAVVILPADLAVLQKLAGVQDSKLMTPRAREAWAPRIHAAALAWGVGFASAVEIDTLGILPATKLAATRALNSLATPADPSQSGHPIPDMLRPSKPIPDYLLTDYLIFPAIELPQTALVKGDRISLSIAAASVLAKTTRDASMRLLDAAYPGYAFERHKGYGTKIHQMAIRKLGLCEIHRKSFSIMRDYITPRNF